MRVLHVTNWPGPPFDGTRINRYHTLRRMSATARCRFVIVRDPHETGEFSSEALAALGIANEGVDVVARRSQSHLGSRLRGLIGSTLPPPIAASESDIGSSLRSVVERVARDWDAQALMVWKPDWAVSLCDTARHLRRVIFACDCFSLFCRSLARSSSNLALKAYGYELSRRFARYERRFLSRYDDVVFVTERDAACANLPPSTSVAVIPNAVDVETFRPGDTEAIGRPRIVFHGNLAHPPNQACVRYLADELGRRLAEELGPEGFDITVIGGGAERLSHRVAPRPWLRFTGYVSDLRAQLVQGTVYAAPLVNGAGIKNKVLEAMACGLPVVGTREAFEGMRIRPGEHAIECPPAAVPREVLALLRDAGRRRALGAAAREWTVANASWDDVARRFDALLRGDRAARAAVRR
jgi:glycosyltransferase involved in cell wall biosynthesis